MASIIKPRETSSQTHGVAFQFADVADKAKAYLETVQADARRIVADAQAQAKQIREQAQREGRAAAMAEMDRAAEQKVAAQVQTLLPALEKMIHDLAQSRHAWLRHWEREAIHLAAALAERVLRRELERQPGVNQDLVREALELAAGSAMIRVHLNPADHASLGEHGQLLARQAAPHDQVEFVADPAITAGGCRVETKFGTIDQQFQVQLARLEEELT